MLSFCWCDTFPTDQPDKTEGLDFQRDIVTFLDNCMIMFGWGPRDDRKHINHEVPCVIADKANGQIEIGRHSVAEEKTPIAKLYLSMLQNAGCEVDSFGDSNGPLHGLAG